MSQHSMKCRLFTSLILASYTLLFAGVSYSNDHIEYKFDHLFWNDDGSMVIDHPYVVSRNRCTHWIHLLSSEPSRPSYPEDDYLIRLGSGVGSQYTAGDYQKLFLNYCKDVTFQNQSLHFDEFIYSSTASTPARPLELRDTGGYFPVQGPGPYRVITSLVCRRSGARALGKPRCSKIRKTRNNTYVIHDPRFNYAWSSYGVSVNEDAEENIVTDSAQGLCQVFGFENFVKESPKNKTVRSKKPRIRLTQEGRLKANRNPVEHGPGRKFKRVVCANPLSRAPLECL